MSDPNLSVTLEDDENELPEGFSCFDFENKLIGIVEELRLRRKVEAENEKVINSLLESKYDLQKSLAEQKRIHEQEVEKLKQEILQLNRQIDNGFSQTADDQLKQENLIGTFANEIRAIKEESKVTHAEKLALEKKIKELEGKLTLHVTFQSAMKQQFSDMQNRTKNLSSSFKVLAEAQKTLKEDVTRAILLLEKYELCNEKFAEIASFLVKQNSFLKSEIISSRSKSILESSQAIDDSKADNDNNNSQQASSVLDEKFSMLQEEYRKSMQTLCKNNKLLNECLKEIDELHEKKKKLSEIIKKYEQESRKLKGETSGEEINIFNMEMSTIDIKEMIAAAMAIDEDETQTGSQISYQDNTEEQNIKLQTEAAMNESEVETELHDDTKEQNEVTSEADIKNDKDENECYVYCHNTIEEEPDGKTIQAEVNENEAKTESQISHCDILEQNDDVVTDYKISSQSSINHYLNKLAEINLPPIEEIEAALLKIREEQKQIREEIQNEMDDMKAKEYKSDDEKEENSFCDENCTDT